MTATLTDTVSAITRTGRPALVGPGVVAGLAAAAATTAVAAVALAAGVSLAAAGEQIPLLGFTQLTFGCSVVGVILAGALRRWAARPRRTFVWTTVGLTALSLAAPCMLPLDAASIAVLVVDHLVAAAIVIPLVARRLR
jgi:hypothetical protein